MRWATTYKHPKGLNFIVQPDTAGIYVYMYMKEDLFTQDLKSGKCRQFQDEDLQDTLEIAKRRAFEMYGVPVDSWKQID